MVSVQLQQEMHSQCHERSTRSSFFVGSFILFLKLVNIFASSITTQTTTITNNLRTMKPAFKWDQITDKTEFDSTFHGQYSPDFDFYLMLDSAPGATFKELKKSFRKKSIYVHPDKGGSTAEFQFMGGFFSWFLDNRSVYDACRSKYLNLNKASSPPASPIRKNAPSSSTPAPPLSPIRKYVHVRSHHEVHESGKAAFYQKKKQLVKKRKYEEPEDMDWEVTSERPVRLTKKRKVTQQPAPVFSHGTALRSKKNRQANRRLGKIFGYCKNGEPCGVCVSKGDYCRPHEKQRPHIANPVPNNNYGHTNSGVPCPNCLLARDFCSQHDPINRSQGGIPGTSTGTNGQQYQHHPGPPPGPPNSVPHFNGQGVPNPAQHFASFNFNVQNVQNMHNSSSTHNGNIFQNQFFPR